MWISQVMTRSVEVIDPDMPVGEVAKRMRDEDIGALPVGENDRLVGMVTDRDIVLRAVAMDRAPSECRVRDVMSEKIFYCFEDQSV
ncbi:MAG: CBS domain-containing protein, partial [Alphaproteobacteria bacterium]|nr:CBS domain-containing protein [Alphaproteobacteria bacterium]